MVEFVRSFPSLSEAEILAVEQDLDLRLPDDLRAFYLAQNGGKPRPDLFGKDDEYYQVQIFLPMRTGDPKVSFEDTYRDMVEDTPEFPKEVIPFAIDDGGDYFLYSLRSRDRGSILFNQSDYYGDEERFVVTLAPSLQAFIDGLTEEEA